MTKPEWTAAFERYAQEMIDTYQVPGMAVGLARDGEAVYEGCFGYRDVAQHLPVTPDTIFGVASITKQFTCVGIMQLQEQGLLSVHDSVVKYLPEFRTPNSEYTRQITLHHFMTHTAGLPPLPSLRHAMVRSWAGDESVRERLEKMGPTEPIDTGEELMAFIAALDFEPLGVPGTRFSYSNDAYGLLGLIIERVSGLSLGEYLTQRIFEPAGMTRTSFDIGALQELGNVTTLYAVRQNQGKDEVFAAPQWWETPAMAGAGFLRSTMRDMLRYLELYRTGGMVGGARILKPESVAAIAHPHTRSDTDLPYGYGVSLTQEYHGMSLVEHGGSLKGISSYMTVAPAQGLTGIILINVQGVPSAQLLLGAFNAASGLAPETTRVSYGTYTPLPHRMPLYAGNYRSGEGEELKVRLADGALMVEYQGKQCPTRAVSQHTFLMRRGLIDEPLRFLFDGEGKVCAVGYHYRIIRRVADES